MKFLRRLLERIGFSQKEKESSEAEETSRKLFFRFIKGEAYLHFSGQGKVVIIPGKPPSE